ncbi:hypothetical protein STVIR_0825 [Streptomyces viridochromogenes Tue57]|uniref:Uncharacterized protein n=1 Tax=Streptomyces viridochromogenes Tue57 TaxID=1160705 RepID=L8PQB2_STRVR|nr:hypothetical protein STVIR_0825 [Streptomyces viridochromogenes Tue57]
MAGPPGVRARRSGVKGRGGPGRPAAGPWCQRGAEKPNP